MVSGLYILLNVKLKCIRLKSAIKFTPNWAGRNGWLNQEIKRNNIMNANDKYELENLLPEYFDTSILTETEWEYLYDVRDDKDAIIAFCDIIKRDFEYEQNITDLEYLNGIGE